MNKTGNWQFIVYVDFIITIMIIIITINLDLKPCINEILNAFL